MTDDPRPDPTPTAWSAPTIVPLSGPGQKSIVSSSEPTSATATPVPPPPPRSRRMWPRRLGIFVALALLAVASGVTGALIGRELDDDPTPPQRASSVALDVGAARDGALPLIDVAAVADYVAPSVVTIIADVEGPQGATASIGTGVITTEDGEIVTNAHVVENASEIRVRLSGETEPRQATLLAADVGNDLALLRIAGDNFVPATFADPDSMRIGDQVVAIGFALDLDGAPSVTLGIVSALDRTIQTLGGALNGLVQTDAAISSGNSGGPLVDALGHVVGINTAVARGDTSVAATNIGFAISTGEALPVIESLRHQAETGVREEGFLGVKLDDRRDGGQGAIITSVEEGTPAESAGIEPGDIVIAIEGVAIDGAVGLVAAVKDQEPGDEIEIQILRGTEVVTVTAVLTGQPET